MNPLSIFNIVMLLQNHVTMPTTITKSMVWKLLHHKVLIIQGLSPQCANNNEPGVLNPLSY